MTGEITLRGRVIPIGGLKEKILAARRGNINTILVPKGNEKDLTGIPKEILKNINIHLVDHMDDVIYHALLEKQEDCEPSADLSTQLGAYNTESAII